ncbi:MAG: GNAT family N-acetyltransferase [Woeseiaceae bacterium]|nr:GNAT family N-acetyltransferase [Woeseiaceae bacterium]
MKIRLAEHSDLEQLAHLRWEHWAENGSDPAMQERCSFITGFEEFFGPELNQDWLVWCAVEAETIVSHAYIQRVRKVPKPSKSVDAFGYVSNVYTRPSHRGAGVGSQVMERVKSWALEADLEFLVLWPSRRSLPFWQRMDYSVDHPLVLELRPYTF